MTIKIQAAARLRASMSDDELARYAKTFWDYAKSVGPVMNPRFEAWFRNRASLERPKLSEAEIHRIWLAAIRMHS